MTLDLSRTLPTNNLPPNLQPSDPAEMEITREMELRREENGCKYFEPNGPQTRFATLLGAQNDFVNIFSAANGVGKTTLIANVVANIFWGPRNQFFDYPIYKRWPYPKRFRFVTDPKLLEEIGPFHSEIKKWWPRGRYEAIKGGKTFYSQYKSDTGFLLDVMSNDQDLKQFEGATLGGVLFDEPPVREIWNACLARLRMGGIACVFMTPLTGAAWFFDEVVPRHQDSIVYGDMEENCKVHGLRGQLEHANIARIIAEMDPDEIEARAHGKAMYLQGLIYKAFDPRYHVLNQHVDPPPGAQVWQIVDPHGDKPFACIWGFTDRTGTLYQIDEWPNEDFYKMHGCNLGINDYRALFLQKEQGWNVTKRIMDRHFAEVRTVHTRRTLREEFAAVGLNYEMSYHGGVEEVNVGIVKVRDYLLYDVTRPIDAVNRPMYYVSPKCINTIKGFTRWSFDQETMKPKDEFKDYMDCVRYWAMHNPRHSDAAPAPEYRKMFG